MVTQSTFGTLSQKWGEAQRWGMRRFALGAKNYWFTFIADSATALFFLIWALREEHTYVPAILLASFAGYMFWGLSEYVFHRWIYHQPEGVFGDGHRIHHAQDLVLIAMPWFMTTMAMFGLWYLIAIKLHFPLFSGILSGWLAGFVWYSVVHHSHHHWNVENSWMRKLKAYHRIHHQFPEYNFGVTMRFWDLVFGTRYHRSPSHSHPQLQTDP